MLFDFKLRPLDQIQPWGTAPDLSLSWFGLTDGLYRLNVGSEHLFSYSAAASKHWSVKYPGLGGDYDVYQVVRLWEDILEILSDVLTPIPPRLADQLSGQTPSIGPWSENVFRWWQSLDDAQLDAEEDRYYTALGWLGKRKLDSLYLQSGPNIWFWSTSDTVTITWDNRGLEIEGVEAWSATQGSFSLSRAAFMDEVRAFNFQLIDQMKTRVEDVARNWNRPEVRIDFDQLRHEQTERARELEIALSRKPEPADWTEIQTAVDYVTRKSSKTPLI